MTQDITRLIAGFRRFQKSWFCADHNLFNDLQEGQNPRALVIACSDSRVDPAILLDCNPGDLFVIRNVANLVPPYEPDTRHHGVSAALEFAVRHLEVEHIIVMGHAHCGGIHALLDEGDLHEGEFIRYWMQIAERARALVEIELPNVDPATRARACEQSAVKVSLDNLLTFPWIRKRVDAGSLLLHGWFFDLAAGSLLGYDAEDDAFTPLVDRCL